MLNSLIIKNFRALENFEVKKLGRVNLIVGKNNSGKSTVLEALRIYAGAANRRLLRDIAESHDEKFQLSENEEYPFEDFFTGRQFPNDDNTQILIGESEISEQLLTIQSVFIVERREEITDENGVIEFRKYRDIIPKSEVENLDSPLKRAFMVFANRKKSILLFDEPLFPREREIFAPCSFIPTRFILMDDLAKEWDKIVFTEHEKTVHEALKIILSEFENLVFVESEHRRSRERGRVATIKLSNLPRPVPLNSLGDGMLRILQLVLKIFPAKGGFLLIDEFENGLHYSVQEKVWALLFEMAEKLDIQIFATTHSWDCIESFTKVAFANEKTEGILFRMGKSAKKSNQGQIISTVFWGEELNSITQANMEVR